MVCMFLRLVLFCLVCGLYAENQSIPEQDLLENLTPYLSCPIGATPAHFTVYAHADGDVLVEESLEDSSNRNILQPHQVKLDGEVIENPLKGIQVKYIQCLQDKPVLVTKQEPATLYMIDNIVSDSQQELLKTEPINDAQGTMGEIVAVGGSGSTMNGLIILGVKSLGSIFGQQGSGLALVKCSHKIYIDDESQGEDKKNTWIDAEELIIDPNDPNRLKIRPQKSYAQTLDASTMKSGNKAYSIDSSHKVISINQGLHELGEHLSVLFDDYGRCFYIGLDVHTADDATDSQGACALAVGRVGPEGFYLAPAFADGDKAGFVTAFGPHNRATIFTIISFDTSTKARYLVVNGGCGEPEISKRSVYAFPVAGQLHLQGKLYQSNYRLLNTSQQTSSGRMTLASRNFFYDDEKQQDKNACFVGGSLLPGPVTSVVTVSDAIIASVSSDEYSTEPGGLFYSQPIFDGTGAICAWTSWQRMAGIQESCERALSFSPLSLSLSIGNNPVNQAVKRVEWSKKKSTDQTQYRLVHVINKLFKPVPGGITHLNSIGPRDCCFDPTSFMIVTGYNAVLLSETGTKVDGHFRLYPNSYETIVEGHNGSIAKKEIESETPVIVTVDGGAVQELGSITDSTLVGNGHYAWLVISGPKGIAVLADENGNGWDPTNGIGYHFANIQGFSFKRLGSFKFVQRIFADNEYLYVLTDKQLVRILLTPETIRRDQLDMFVCVQADKSLGNFYECGISGPLCLLGTSKGLFCNGVGTDIRLNEPLSWHYIPLSCQQGMAYNFSYKTVTGANNDFGRGGQVYVQYGSRYNDYTHIYRFYIKDVYSEGIQEDSVARLADVVVDDEARPYCSFYNFRSQFMPSCFDFSCFSGSPQHPGYVQIFQIKNNIGRVFRPSNGITLPMKTKKIHAINACMQEKATGNWFIAGDFGMRVFGL